MNVRVDFIIHMAKQGHTANKIVEMLREKGIPTAKKTVTGVLNDNGFAYDKKNHIWLGPESNENLIETNIGGEPPEEKLEILNDEKDREPTQIVVKKNTPSPNLFFTDDELAALKILANERMQYDMAASTTTGHDIYSNIAKLNVRRRKNKTYYMSEQIADDVAQMADEMGVKISNFVEVALIDAMMKYKK